MDPSDTELLKRLAGGEDPRAWSVIVNRYSQTLWHITGNYGLDSSLRQDVVQTVWLKLFDRIGTIRQPERLVGWLAQVARNECINVLRSQSRYQFGDDPIELDPDEPKMTDRLERDYSREKLVEAFAGLDLRCRELLALCIADPPVPYDEISTQLHIPRGSIGPTRQRCLQKLRGMAAVTELDPKGIPND